MTMITPSYLGETIEYSSLHACRSTLEDPTMENQSSGFIEVSRAILSDYGMQIWYGDNVSLTCSMKIFSHSTAETFIINRPLNPGMKSSIPLYVALKIPVVQRKGHFMEHGLS